ncbi:UDP-2,3-diacylglucosamine hydrolase [Thalassobaculum fulvum]|uniref:UDP-2,3-diacylglucosamine hydrolase n=1 Tax=Thalassobaculum fulvum TaxID=1633335 RepID=A0A918XTP1_9PROT|nr:UDP-2,3-diacylglucosamine diphosphatase [Thalassobaculum fulvum]GHD55176.1 UDP-2,3-diacylglucosamine hydrolase [Thalassobaculum fulvum]
MNAERGAMRYRSIWISDVHLGTRGCQAEQLLDFLKHTESEHLYLVGDIIDLWRMRRSWAWRQAHNDVIQKLLRKARKGTKVMFIPGNHDEMFREFLNADFGQIEIRPEHVHVTRKGERFLVIHGDEFDAVVTYAKWLAVLGDWSYNTLLSINTVFNDVRRRLGYPYWSLSAYLKQKAKRAVEFIGRFEQALATEAARRGVDGVICGHIHKAEMRRIGEVLYCNDGDWVESCTALVEHMNGELEILHWTEVRQMALVA